MFAVINELQHDSSSIYVEGELGKRKLLFCVDTGASHSIIRPELVSVGLDRRKQYVLRTVTGDRVPVHGTVRLHIGLKARI